MDTLLSDVISLRHDIHMHPGVGADVKIIEFLHKYDLSPYAMSVGGAGILYKLTGTKTSSTTTMLLRADIDGLPVKEMTRDTSYRSVNDCHHGCGHDGHAAMLAGALAWLQSHTSEWSGVVYAMFQHGEEDGTGACQMVNDPVMKDLECSRAFGLHNIPGYPLGTILYKPGPFAVASTGVCITMTGSSCHASEPFRGVNPIPALCNIATWATGMPSRLVPFNNNAMVTLIGLIAGGDSFGTSAYEGRLNLTLRARDQTDLDHMVNALREYVSHVAYDMTYTFTLVDPFPAVVCSDEPVEYLCRSVQGIGLSLQRLESPFSWSEDFGHVSSKWPSCFFGLGSGDTPVLHATDYDFPDALIPYGMNVWLHLVKSQC